MFSERPALPALCSVACRSDVTRPRSTQRVKTYSQMCIWTIGLERRQKRPQIAGLKYKFGIEYWTSINMTSFQRMKEKRGGKEKVIAVFP